MCITNPARCRPTHCDAARIPRPAIANPASQNCLEKGGTLSFEERGDGGQFGVCYFEDNRQCEELALMRGDCPAVSLLPETFNVLIASVELMAGAINPKLRPF